MESDFLQEKKPGETRYQDERAEDIRWLLTLPQFRRFGVKLVTELGLLAPVVTTRDAERRQVALELFTEFKQSDYFKQLLMETIQ